MKIPMITTAPGGSGGARGASTPAGPAPFGGAGHGTRVLPAKKVTYCVPVSCKVGNSLTDSWEYCEEVNESAITHGRCTTLKESARAAYAGLCAGRTETNRKCYVS